MRTRIEGRRALALLFVVMLLLQGVMPTYAETVDDSAATPQVYEVYSQRVSPGMLNVRAARQGPGRSFRINWLPDSGIAPDTPLTVIASWEGGSQTKEVGSAGDWSCQFDEAPPTGAVVYVLAQLDRDTYYDYPAGGKDAISISEIAHTPVIKTWYNTPEEFRQPVNVTVTMVSGVDGTPGGTGNVLGHISGLAGIGKGDGETVTDTDDFYFPKYNSDGKAFHSFEVQELTLGGHLVSLDGDQEYKQGETITLHNTMKRELRVVKTWAGRVDDGNDAVEINLVRVNDRQVMQTLRIEKDADGSWPARTFDAVPLGGMLEGSFQPFSYTVEEVGVYNDDYPGQNLIGLYDVAYPAAPNWQTTGFTVTNTRKIDKDQEVEVEIVKTWDDQRDPASRFATFTITRLNGEDNWSSQVILSAAQNGTFSKAFRYPKYSPITGEAYIYHVRENASEDFIATFQRKETLDDRTIWHFLNESVRRSVTVTKQWIGDDAAARPPVTLYLLRDGQRIKDEITGLDIAITLQPGETAHTFDDVPRFDKASGREYVYTVEESPVPAGYYAVADGLTVENRRVEDDGDPIIFITKRWDPAGKLYDVFPAVTLQLYERLQGGEDRKVGPPLVMPEGTRLSRLFTILQGEGIALDPAASYYVVEVTEPGDQWTVTGGDVTWDGRIGTATLTNMLKKDLIERKPTYVPLIIRKVWSVPDAPEGFTSISEYIATLPASFTLRQYIDGEASAASDEISQTGGAGDYSADGSASIHGNGYITLRVPQYDAEGRHYTYEVDEAAITGFRTTTFVADNNFVFTNTVDTMPINARKTWLNLAQRGDFDVAPVSLTLYRRAGNSPWEKVGQTKVISNFDLKGAGAASYLVGETAFGAFATHGYVDGAFQPYEYMVTEEYDMTDEKYFTTTGREVTGGLADIRNTYDKYNEKTQFTVNKDWIGGTVGEAYPDVTIALYADGLPVRETVLSAASATPWSYTFRDLDKYRPAGQGEERDEIQYTAKETAIGGIPLPADASVTISDGTDSKVYKLVREYMMGNSDYFAVNSLVTLEKDLEYDIVGNKAWGTLPPGTKLPDSVTFVLLQDGKYYDSAVLTEGTGWQCRFRNVKYFNEMANRPYTYLLYEEDPPTGFYPLIRDAMQFDRDADGRLYAHATLINIPTEDRDVRFVKAWEGGTPALRVDENGVAQVVLTLRYGGGSRQITLTPDGDGNWSATVRLPITTEQNGSEYVLYEIVEPLMPHYSWRVNRYTGGLIEDPTDNHRFRLAHGGAEAVVTVVNQLNTSTTIQGAKLWVDAQDGAGLRPDSLALALEARREADGGLVSSTPVIIRADDSDVTVTTEQHTTHGAVTMWRWSQVADAFDTDGEPLAYRWRETVVPPHYCATGDDLFSYPQAGSVKPIVNRMEMVDVSGKKTWENTLGGKDFGAIHPSGPITVQLMRRAQGGQPEVVGGYTATVDAANGWQWSWSGLPKYDGNGNAYTYFVREETSVPGYESEAGPDAALTNRLLPHVVKVVKAWHADGDGADRVPIDIELTATIGGTAYSWPGRLEADNQWTYSFGNLPMYDSSTGTMEAIQYTVRELNVPDGYVFVMVIRGTGGDEQYVPVEGDPVVGPFPIREDAETTITLHNARLLRLTGVKRWIDGGNAHGSRPLDAQGRPSVTIHLQRDSGNGYTTIGTETFTGTGDTWTFTWPEAMPLSGPGGVYSYRFVEAVPPAYTCGNAENAIAADGSETLTNTLRTIDIDGKKTWSGPPEEPGLRPPEIEITLKRRTPSTGAVDTIDSVTLDAAGQPSWQWRGLPERNGEGEIYEYSIEETALAGYTTQMDAFDVTNAMRTVSITVIKEWRESNGDAGARPKTPIKLTLHAYIGDGDSATELFTREHTIRDDAHTNWRHTFDNLPMYDSATGAQRLIRYRIEESRVSGYQLLGADGANTLPVSFGAGTEAEVLLVNERRTIDLTVTKAWVGDEAFAADTRPARVTFYLDQLDAQGALVRTHEKDMIRANNGDWPPITFTDLPAVDDDGNAYRYSLREATVPGYDVRVVQGMADGVLTGFHVTNTLAPIELTVNKRWLDEENTAGIRPDALTLRLLRALDQPGGTYAPYGQERTLSLAAEPDASSWRIGWPDPVPPNNGEGIAYLYRFEEVDVHPAYHARVAEAPAGGTLENELPLQDLVGEKHWNDAMDSEYGDLSSLRPDAITIELWRRTGQAAGEYVDEMTVGAADGWAWHFENLPVYARYDDIAYEYYIVEAPLAGYTASYSAAAGSDHRMHVSNTPDLLDIEVVKAAWGDAGYEDEARPDQIVITLTGQAEGEAPFSVSGELVAPDWTATFRSMPRTMGGKEITYTVAETVPDGYIDGLYTEAGQTVTYPVITSETEEGRMVFSIENRLRLHEVVFTKQWQEGDYQGTLQRPAAIYVDLWRTTGNLGNTADPSARRILENHRVNVPEGDSFTVAFPGLRVVEGEKTFYYWIAERTMPGYFAAGVGDGMSVTNVLDTVNVRIVKIWRDERTRQIGDESVFISERPESVTATLVGTAHGREVYRQAHTLRPDGWAATIVGLPRYAYSLQGDDPQLVTYRVEEAALTAYETAVDASGLAPAETGDYEAAITNTLRTEDITITKRFAGDAGMIARGHSPRPAAITIHLYRAVGGIDDDRFALTQQIDGIVNATDTYTSVFKGLPMYDADGNAYTYYADEEPVPGYAKAISEDGRTITNTLEITRVYGVKRWADEIEGSAYRARPQTITIELIRSLEGAADADFREEVAIDYDGSATEQAWAFEDLARISPSGAPYAYHVTERAVSGYTTTYTEQETEDGQYVEITNELKRIQIVVEKKWLNDAEHPAYRPATLDVQLVGQGTDGRQYYEGTKAMTAPASDDGTWTVTFDGLPRLAANGEPIQYTVSEGSLPAYEMTELAQPRVDSNENTLSYAATITNRLRVTSLGGDKTWADADNRHGTRPVSIEIALRRTYTNPVTNAETTETVETRTVEAPWRWTFDNLPALHTSGAAYRYFVEETSADARYATTHTGDDPMRLTNTLRTQDVVVTKVWEDGQDRNQVRPTSVTIELRSSTNVRYTGSITSVRGWQFVFSGLPKYTKDGDLITYTLSESVPPGYQIRGQITQPVPSAAEAYTASITNELLTTGISVRKAWSGGPTTGQPAVTVRLLEGTRLVDSIILNAANGWAHTFEGLPRYRNGVEIRYDVQELAVEGYATAIQRTATNTGTAFVITNTYQPPTSTPTITPGPTVTPSPSPTITITETRVPRTGYTQILDLDIPLGIGPALNLGDCFD